MQADLHVENSKYRVQQGGPIKSKPLGNYRQILLKTHQ